MNDQLAMLENAFCDMVETVSDMGLEKTASTESEAGTKRGFDFEAAEIEVTEWIPLGHAKENRIDIIPFIVSEPWIEKLLHAPPTQEQREAGQIYAKKRNLKQGSAMSFFEIPFHRYADGDSGDAVCLREAFGEKCPHCQRMFEEYKKRKQGDPEADEKAKSLKPTWRTWANIYNHDTSGDALEVINDVSRAVFHKNIITCSRNTEVGDNFVYPWPHPKAGYTLRFDSVWNTPTGGIYTKGYFEFPVIKFDKRPEGTDFTPRISECVQFDKLATPLIYTYEEMEQMLAKKMIDKTEQKEDDIPAPPINDTDSNIQDEEIDDNPAWGDTQERPGRRQPLAEKNQDVTHKEVSHQRKGRRKPRR